MPAHNKKYQKGKFHCPLIKIQKSKFLFYHFEGWPIPKLLSLSLKTQGLLLLKSRHAQNFRFARIKRMETFSHNWMPTTAINEDGALQIGKVTKHSSYVA